MREKAPAKKEGKLAVSDHRFQNSEAGSKPSQTEKSWENADGVVDYRLLFANSIEAILVLTPFLDESGKLSDALITDVNPAFSDLTGIPHEHACGKRISELMPPGASTAMLDTFRADIEIVAAGARGFPTRAAHREEKQSSHAPETSPRGSGQVRRGEVYWSASDRYFLYQIFALDAHHVAALGVDITAQKQTLRALQENQARLVHTEEQVEQHAARLGITHKLIESREAERLSIANHLHEGLLQALIGIRYALQEGLDIEQKEKRLARLAAVQATLQREIQTLRDYCNELRPPTLAPFGLEKTIRSHVENYQKKNVLPVIHLDLAADRQALPESIRIILFRVFQQILKGSVARQQVRHIWVRFFFDEDQATLEMQDDGDGANLPAHWFDLNKQDQMELASAFERVEGIGGMMNVELAPGKGTLVRVTVPTKIGA